jgi:uncharacterized alkaline shock family protein YloU
MHRIDLILDHGWFTISTQPDGLNRVSAWVISLIAQRATRRVEGVSAAVIELTFATDQPDEQRLRLQVDIVAAYGIDLEELAGTVRTAVARDLRRLARTEVAQVDVHVSDVKAV